MVELPRHILDRVERVYAFHRATKLFFNGANSCFNETVPQPSPYRIFPDQPKVALPTPLLYVPMGSLAVLESSLHALPDSFVCPPPTLKTLANFLYMATARPGRRPNGPD